jgi:hypothetical protein
MRGNSHVRFGGAGRGNGPPERAVPRPGPTLHRGLAGWLPAPGWVASGGCGSALSVPPNALRLGQAGLCGDLLNAPSAAALVTGKAFHDTQVSDRYCPGVPARVYLLGGSSSVGKTTAATALAERLGAVHLVSCA